MAKTTITDIVVPSLFERYTVERSATKSEFFSSGIVYRSPVYDELASRGGRTVELPFWQDLAGDRQILSSSASLTPQKITAVQDSAFIHNDAQAWSVNHLASVASGEDPIGVIINLIASYWARQNEKVLLSSLKGIFASSSMSGNKLVIASESTGGVSDSTRLNGSTFIDATAKLGDSGDALTAIAVHSVTEATLRKYDLIDYVPDSSGVARIKTFQGRRLIVDDNLPVRSGTTSGTVYTSYLFGDGAFVCGFASLDGKPVDGGFGTEGVEFARVPLDSDTLLINRRRFILHPRGVKFTAVSVSGASPTNAELENGSNWTRVYENKNVRIVAIEHNN